MRTYDCDEYVDMRAPAEVAQVHVLVNLAGTDWRVIFHAEGGTQVSVSRRVNEKSAWYVPVEEDESDSDKVVAAARALLGSHPFKREVAK